MNNESKPDELELLPKHLILELSRNTVGPFAVKMRGQRNKYRGLYNQTMKNLTIAKVELFEARMACKRMREELEKIHELH